MTRDKALVAATSPNWEHRMAAAETLAATADIDHDVMLRLLTDDENTAVIQAAAVALLKRRDLIGVRLFLEASAEMDDDSGNHLNDALWSVPIESRAEVAELMLDAGRDGFEGADDAASRLGPIEPRPRIAANHSPAADEA